MSHPRLKLFPTPLQTEISHPVPQPTMMEKDQKPSNHPRAVWARLHAAKKSKVRTPLTLASAPGSEPQVIQPRKV